LNSGTIEAKSLRFKSGPWLPATNEHEERKPRRFESWKSQRPSEARATVFLRFKSGPWLPATNEREERKPRMRTPTSISLTWSCDGCSHGGSLPASSGVTDSTWEVTGQSFRTICVTSFAYDCWIHESSTYRRREGDDEMKLVDSPSDAPGYGFSEGTDVVASARCVDHDPDRVDR